MIGQNRDKQKECSVADDDSGNGAARQDGATGVLHAKQLKIITCL